MFKAIAPISGQLESLGGQVSRIHVAKLVETKRHRLISSTDAGKMLVALFFFLSPKRSLIGGPEVKPFINHYALQS